MSLGREQRDQRFRALPLAAGTLGDAMLRGVGGHGFVDALASAAKRSAVHERGTHGEAVQPRLGVGGGPQGGPIPHGGDGDILHDVVGAFKATQPCNRHGPQPRSVHPQRLLRICRQGANGGERFARGLAGRHWARLCDGQRVTCVSPL